MVENPCQVDVYDFGKNILMMLENNCTIPNGTKNTKRALTSVAPGEISVSSTSLVVSVRTSPLMASHLTPLV
jgi:hypothetical protein